MNSEKTRGRGVEGSRGPGEMRKEKDLKRVEKFKVEKHEKSTLGINIRYSIFDIRVKAGRLKVENIFTGTLDPFGPSIPALSALWTLEPFLL